MCSFWTRAAGGGVDRSRRILLIDARRPRRLRDAVVYNRNSVAQDPPPPPPSDRHLGEKERNSRRIAVSCPAHLAAPFFVTQYTRFVRLFLLHLFNSSPLRPASYPFVSPTLRPVISLYLAWICGTDEKRRQESPRFNTGREAGMEFGRTHSRATNSFGWIRVLPAYVSLLMSALDPSLGRKGAGERGGMNEGADDSELKNNNKCLYIFYTCKERQNTTDTWRYTQFESGGGERCPRPFAGYKRDSGGYTYTGVSHT